MKNKYKAALLFWLLGVYTEHKLYYSLDTYLYLSCGSIYDFIGLCRNLFDELESDYFDTMDSNAQISPKVQTYAAKKYAESQMEKLRINHEYGLKMWVFTRNMCNLFSYYHKGDLCVTYPETNQFYIKGEFDSSGVNQEIWRSLLKWGVVIKKSTYQRASLSENNKVQLYYMNVYYTEPDLYRYENFDITQYQQDDYHVSLNYPQNYYSTRTTEDEEIFVGILGFQKNVLKLLQDNNEVTEFYSINGFPSFYPKAKDISQVNNWDYLAQLQNSHKFCADASNPFLCYNALTDIYNASKKAFMTICPLGSKPMLLGALLFVIKHSKNTRIVYPYDEFIRTKADGVGRTYCFRIMD